jgi:hypothetical protein
MKKSTCAAIIGFTIFVFSGCAPVKFYSNSELTASTGLKYYTSKPFLLVEKDLVNGNITKATVIYLPDLLNPQYINVKGGIGSKKLDLKLTDGSINTFGLDSDTKIAESVNALASLISKGTSVIADLTALKALPPTAAAPTVTELYEVFMDPTGTTLKKVEFKQ